MAKGRSSKQGSKHPSVRRSPCRSLARSLTRSRGRSVGRPSVARQRAAACDATSRRSETPLPIRRVRTETAFSRIGPRRASALAFSDFIGAFDNTRCPRSSGKGASVLRQRDNISSLPSCRRPTAPSIPRPSTPRVMISLRTSTLRASLRRTMSTLPAGHMPRVVRAPQCTHALPPHRNKSNAHVPRLTTA